MRQQVETLLAEGVDLRAQVEAAQASIQSEAVRADVLERRVQESDADGLGSPHAVERSERADRWSSRRSWPRCALSDSRSSACSGKPSKPSMRLRRPRPSPTCSPNSLSRSRRSSRGSSSSAARAPGSRAIWPRASRIRWILPTSPSTMSEDSIITTAATLGVYEYGTAEQLVDSHRLPGDVPAFAVAAPLVFQGETLAVVYADTTENDKGEAHAAFAGVLAAHTNVLLSRLTQELKVARELREYAQMLLHEAEEMFVADTKEGRTRAGPAAPAARHDRLRTSALCPARDTRRPRRRRAPRRRDRHAGRHRTGLGFQRCAC